MEKLLTYKQVTDEKSLAKLNYNNLIVLLATLSPDSVW